MAVQARTHTLTHTHIDVCAAFSADWAPHRMFCGAKNRSHLQSAKKKKGTLHLPVSKSTRLGSPHRLAAVCERELSSGYVQVPEDTPRLPQKLTGHRTPQFIQDVFISLPIHIVKGKNTNIRKQTQKITAV